MFHLNVFGTTNDEFDPENNVIKCDCNHLTQSATVHNLHVHDPLNCVKFNIMVIGIWVSTMEWILVRQWGIYIYFGPVFALYLLFIEIVSILLLYV